MPNTTSFIRITKTGFSNFSRNWLLSVAATLVMTITLIIFAILALLFTVSNYSVRAIQERVDISIYMKKGLAEDRILDIKRALEGDEFIREVQYISAADALAQFKNNNQNNPVVISALNTLDENPLLATLRVKAKNIQDYPQIAENISAGQFSAFIEDLNYRDNRKVIDNLTKILNIIVPVGIALIIIFSVIAILVLFNTLRLTIYNRREEVEIMRLVGATNWYIRGPFLAEGVMYSLAAVVVTGVLLVPIYARVLPKISGFMGNSLPVSNIMNYWFLLGLLLLVALVLSVISTLLAIRKYLKI